jgi:flagellar hook-basal body protein
VNDLGAAGINNPAGPTQACYAWYAFDTTGGQPVATVNLLGGTGIWQGDPVIYDRGNPGVTYYGDFIWFNTDGSLGGSGGAGGVNGGPGLASNFMMNPRVYLPPFNFPGVSPLPSTGAEIMAVDLDFGTFGLLGQAGRDGLTGDAEGSYQPVNGVQTYIPKNTVYAATQDGYTDGILQGVNFDNQGNVVGSFSNGQEVNLARVVLADVQNPDGLNKAGANAYTASVNSGPSHLGFAGDGNFGKIQGSSLEGSNVDLTVELSNMIVAQRSFEVNARMVSVVNDTLNVINNLGR